MLLGALGLEATAVEGVYIKLLASVFSVRSSEKSSASSSSWADVRLAACSSRVPFDLRSC